MNGKIVKESLQKMSEALSFKYPAPGWYFSADNIKNSFIKRIDGFVCLCVAQSS